MSQPAHRLSAASIQPPDDTARMLAERADKGVARTLNLTFTVLIASLDQHAMADAIRANSFTALWRHMALERLHDASQPMLNRLALVHDQSAQAASLAIPAAPRLRKARPSSLRTPDVINLTYDPLDPATVAAQNRTSDAIADNIEETAETTAQQILADGLRAGDPAAVIARRLRETLGLSISEANAIQSYRSGLMTGSSAPFLRALRDRRYDARAQRSDLSGAQIEQMVDRYAQRYRSFRAERLARTETLRAANQGRLAAWKQYAARTGRGPDDITRFWLTAGDELVCPICTAIPGMNPDGVSLDQPYDSPIGPVMSPPDPHPLCRCTERIARSASDAQETDSAISGLGLRVELDYK